MYYGMFVLMLFKYFVSFYKIFYKIFNKSYELKYFVLLSLNIVKKN